MTAEQQRVPGPRINWARPLAIDPRALVEDLSERGIAGKPYIEEGDAAIIEIRGPLMQRPAGFWSLFCDDYESIRGRVGAALASGASRVIMRIDSPGGDASGCLELARELRSMARASGKRLIAFGEGVVASAAYAIASAADELHVTPTTNVGSVGVIATMVDQTALDAALGVRVALVVSGERKADGNPHAPLTEDVIARAQTMVDTLAALFFGVVTDHRPIDDEQLRALGGGMLVGAAAFGTGLIDRVSTWAEVIAGAVGSLESPNMATSKKGFDAAKEALRAIVDDEKAEAGEREKARKSLRALEEEPKAEEEPAKKDDEPAKEDAKASADEPKKEDKDKDGMRAAASAPTAVDVERLVETALQKRDRVQAEQAEVRDLLATRPDFDASMRATLSKLPLAEVKAAVKDWPRRAALSPAAGASAMPTVQGSTQGDLDYALDADTTRQLDAIMGHDGRSAPTNPQAMVYGSFDKKMARAHLERIEGKGGSR